MNPIEMLLNYLDVSKFLVMFTIILIILVSYFVLSSDLSIFSDESNKIKEKVSSPPSSEIKEKVNESKENKEQQKEKKTIEIRGFQQNEVNSVNHKFILTNETEKVEHLSQKIIYPHQDLADKNDELSLMLIESISSLNSWKNDEIQNEIFKEINWNLEKRHNTGSDESLVYQYVFPQIKQNNNISPVINLSSSQSSINSNSETEDGEEEKERALLSSYKLGICRTFDYSEENKIKSNIVKEVNGNLYKIYSEGNPDLIKEKCRKDTIPENFDEMMVKYKREGYEVIAFSGKKMKMNYIQSQRVERIKCESNMIFLGFAIYKIKYDRYKSAYS